MPEHTAYESGARVPKPATKEQLHEDFSQKAADNRKPPLGVGLTEKIDQERSDTDKSDLVDSERATLEGEHHPEGFDNHGETVSERTPSTDRAKVPGFDPAMAPVETDAEAGGTASVAE